MTFYFLKPINDAMESVFDEPFAEVDHQPKFQIHQPQISQSLRLEHFVVS